MDYPYQLRDGQEKRRTNMLIFPYRPFGWDGFKL
jgi:hypothetical protein